jgi:hypothetical protein
LRSMLIISSLWIVGAGFDSLHPLQSM